MTFAMRSPLSMGSSNKGLEYGSILRSYKEFRMPLKTFSLLTVLGCVIWNAVLIYAGYAAGGLWETVVGSSFALAWNVLLAVIAATSALYLAVYAYALGKSD